MADANYVKFSSRLNKIDSEHQKMASGYVHLVERDGLLVPVSAQRSQRAFPYRPLLLIAAGFFCFKVFLLTYLGAFTYGDRVGMLANGSVGEQFGAWIMSADPVTIWVSTQILMLL